MYGRNKQTVSMRGGAAERQSQS